MLTHYVIVRKDLPKGVIAAQLVHAAGESMTPGHHYAVVLAVADEYALLDIELALCTEGIEHVSVREPDAPHNGALMAIGVKPCERDSVRNVLRSLATYK